MLTCHDVANYFLTKVDVEEGEVITNLKMQKLAYYVQSASLAFYDAPLFTGSLEAWKHGPVVPELYHSFKQHNSDPLPRVEELDLSLYSQRDLKLMNDVYTFFGQFAAWKLRDMTHEETPWLEAYPTQSVISHVSMRDYFRFRWADDMLVAVDDSGEHFQALRAATWQPTSTSLAAALRYKKGRVDGDRYMSEAA